MEAEKTVPERTIPSYVVTANVVKFTLRPQDFIVDVDFIDDNGDLQHFTADMNDEWDTWAQLKKDEWNIAFRKIVSEALNIPIEDVTGDLWT